MAKILLKQSYLAKYYWICIICRPPGLSRLVMLGKVNILLTASQWAIDSFTWHCPEYFISQCNMYPCALWYMCYYIIVAVPSCWKLEWMSFTVEKKWMNRENTTSWQRSRTICFYRTMRSPALCCSKYTFNCHCFVAFPTWSSDPIFCSCAK